MPPDHAPAAALATRFATPADAALVAELFLEAGRHYWGERPDDRAISRRAADQVLGDDAGSRLLLGFRAGDAVAFTCFAILQPGPSEQGVLFMKELFVRAHARGERIGEAMMGQMARLAVARGCQRFDWTAETGNPRAVAFYDGLAAPRVVEKVYFRLAGQRLADFAAAAAPDAAEEAGS